MISPTLPLSHRTTDMTDTTHLEAKVLLLDHDSVQCKALSDFCKSVGLLPVLRTSHDAIASLEKHKDLAGVLLAEDLPCDGGDGLYLAEAIHKSRPELPIILRRDDLPTLDDLSESLRHVFCAAYTTSDLSALSRVIDEYIFSLVRG